MTALSDDHDALLGRGRRLQQWTIAWNLMEVFVTIGLGIAAGSLALVAFGLDSIVEVFASVVTIWYIKDHHADRRSLSALRLVAASFVILGVYLLVASAYSIATGARAESSPFGIAYLVLTAGVMFGLARVKRVAALASNSAPLRAEASMTFLDGCLATGILVALVLNAAAGLWWADPAAALLVAAACFREALDTWQVSNEEERSTSSASVMTDTSAGPSAQRPSGRSQPHSAVGDASEMRHLAVEGGEVVGGELA